MMDTALCDFEFQACCLKTCKQFECPADLGWATWESVANDIGSRLSMVDRANVLPLTRG